MTTTAIFSVTHWTAGQSQPEVPVNYGLNIFDAAIAGTITVNASADSDQTLAVTGAKPQAWQHSRIILTDTSAVWTGAHNVIVPDNAKNYIFTNNASTGYDAVFKTVAGSGVLCAYGDTIHVRCDGSSIVREPTPLSGYAETYAVASVTSSSTVLNVSAHNIFSIVMTANASVVFDAVASAGNKLVTAVVRYQQNVSGGWAANVVGAIYASGVASTLTQTASALDIWVYNTFDGGATWIGNAMGRDYK